MNPSSAPLRLLQLDLLKGLGWAVRLDHDAEVAPCKALLFPAAGPAAEAADGPLLGLCPSPTRGAWLLGPRRAPSAATGSSGLDLAPLVAALQRQLAPVPAAGSNESAGASGAAPAEQDPACSVVFPHSPIKRARLA